MTNNDIMRRVRYIFELNDAEMIGTFGLAGCQVTRDQVSAWLKKEEDPGFRACDDTTLATFLNGFISKRRGKREGAQPEPEPRLTNNLVLMKLKIALNLKAEEVMALLSLAGCPISKHEPSAFFRRPSHKHYRECRDQVLRNFLKGLQFKVRGG